MHRSELEMLVKSLKECGESGKHQLHRIALEYEAHWLKDLVDMDNPEDFLDRLDELQLEPEPEQALELEPEHDQTEERELEPRLIDVLMAPILKYTPRPKVQAVFDQRYQQMTLDQLQNITDGFGKNEMGFTRIGQDLGNTGIALGGVREGEMEVRNVTGRKFNEDPFGDTLDEQKELQRQDAEPGAVLKSTAPTPLNTVPTPDKPSS